MRQIFGTNVGNQCDRLWNTLFNPKEYRSFESLASPTMGLLGAYTECYHQSIINNGVNFALRTIGLGTPIVLPKLLTSIAAFLLCWKLLTPLVYGELRLVLVVWNLMTQALAYLLSITKTNIQ